MAKIVTTRARRDRGGGGGHACGTGVDGGGQPDSIDSLVFTLLVTLTVVGLAIAGAMAVAIKDPNQPATLRAPRPRASRPARPRRTPAPRPVRQAAPTRVVSVPATADVSIGHFTDHWATTGKTSPWLRLRSGVVLTVLLTVVGTLIALSIAGVIVLLALAIRSAVS